MEMGSKKGIAYSQCNQKNLFWPNTAISLTNEIWSEYLLMFINSLLL